MNTLPPLPFRNTILRRALFAGGSAALVGFVSLTSFSSASFAKTPAVTAEQATLSSALGVSDALAAIDKSRSPIVKRIVSDYSSAAAAKGIGAADLRALLMSLRADELLAASLVNDIDGLVALLKNPAQDASNALRYQPVAPAKVTEFTLPTQAQAVLIQQGEVVSVSPLASFNSELSSHSAVGTLVLGYFEAPTANTRTTVIDRTSGDIAKDGVGSGSGSWIGYTAGGNAATATGSAVAAGTSNAATGQGAFVGSGTANQANGVSSLVIGGFDNRATSTDAIVGAGAGNRATGARSIIVGGGYNLASGNFSFLGGGGRSGTASTAAGTNAMDNKATGEYSVVVGGGGNTASGHGSFVGGGSICCAPGQTSTFPNLAAGRGSVIVGGYQNTTNGPAQSIGGGYNNTTGTNGAPGAAYGATVAGGEFNSATGDYATIPGGIGNTANGARSFAAGNNATASTANSFVWSDGTAYNPANGANTFNIASASGVHLNTNTNLNFGSQTRQMINLWGAAAQYGIGVQSGTQYYRVDSDFNSGSVGGYAWFQGGVHSDTAFDAGTGGGVMMQLTRGPSLQFPLDSPTDQQIKFRLSGSSGQQGIGGQSSTTYIRTNANIGFYLAGAHTNGTALDPGAGGSVLATIQNGAGSAAVTGNVRALGFTPTSDRASKTAFSAVNAKSILAKVAALPITTWMYNAEKESGVRHIGPVAQDFKKAFNVGYDDKSISLIDSSGVALTAIKGLNEIVAEKDAKISALERANVAMQRELAAIKKKLGM